MSKASSAIQSVSSSYNGKVTKTGAPDMRTSAAKAYVASQGSTYTFAGSSKPATPSYSGYTGPMTKTGAPDMRYSAAKSYVASYTPSASSFYGGGGGSSYTAASSSSSSSYASYSGPTTRSGAPDMRTTAGKAWAAANK